MLSALLVISGLTTGAFAVALGVFLESSHSGSTLRLAGRRIAGWVRSDPERHSVVLNAFSDVSRVFSWLDASFLLLLASSALLLFSGIAVFRGPRPRSSS